MSPKIDNIKGQQERNVFTWYPNIAHKILKFLLCCTEVHLPSKIHQRWRRIKNKMDPLLFLSNKVYFVLCAAICIE